MVRLIFPISTLLAVTNLAADQVKEVKVDKKCQYALDVVQLQDGTSSFMNFAESMAKKGEELYNNLRQSYTSLRYGIASFGDKPIPLRGRGPYGNFGPPGAVIDDCYAIRSPLSDSSAQLKNAFDDIRQASWSGGDLPEDIFGGMYYAAVDSEIGWTAPEIESRNHAAMARIMLVITDDIPHVKNDSAKGLEAWTWPVTTTPKINSTTPDVEYKRYYGGFGAWNFPLTGGINGVWFNTTTNDVTVLEVAWPNAEDRKREKDNMIRLSKLKAEMQMYHINENYMDAWASKDEWNELVKRYGPSHWVIKAKNDTVYDQFQPFNGKPEDCSITEYVGESEVGRILKEKKIFPIFLIAKHDGGPSLPHRDFCKHVNANRPLNNQLEHYDCLLLFYRMALKKWDIPGVVESISYNVADVASIINQAVIKLTNGLCLLPPTTTTSTTTTTTTTTTTSSPTTTTTTTSSPTTTTTTTSSPTTTTTTTTTPTTTTTTPTTTTTTPTTTTTTPTTTTTTPTTTTTTTSTTTTPKSGQVIIPPPVITKPTEKPAVSEKPTHKATLTTTTTSSGCGCDSPCPEGQECSCPCNDEVPPPPIGEKKKTPVGAIAGATAGAVGGAGALAAAAYGKFGGSLFGGSSGAGAAEVTQVQAPDNPVERETMEEVTIDMFS